MLSLSLSLSHAEASRSRLARLQRARGRSNSQEALPMFGISFLLIDFDGIVNGSPVCLGNLRMASYA